jgi:hypothetical protein
MPWKGLDSLEGSVEMQFLRRTLFGASIAPFRVIDESAEAVIPWTGDRLLDGGESTLDEYPGLAKWWRLAEEIWEANRSDSTRLTLREQLDYYGKLSSQFPLPAHRVLYTKSGVRITACRIEGDQTIVDHTLYWAAVASRDEGRYLTAIFNSNAIHERIEPLMSEGLFGKRHVDKYVFAVAFPTFDPESALHREIVGVAAMAEKISKAIVVPEGGNVTAARREIRNALDAKGVSAKADALVLELLATSPVPV